MEKKDGTNIEDRRLWIGNLDPRVTEYQLLKLLQKYGAIEKFDLLFHRAGPLAGQPRGYAFVTYLEKRSAVEAQLKMHNAQVGIKKILVTWAHSVNNDDMDKPKAEMSIPALAMSKVDQKTDRESQIQAIEAKLKLMAHRSEEELKINDTVAAKPSVVTQYQYYKPPDPPLSLRSKRNQKTYVKPYTKHKSRR